MSGSTAFLDSSAQRMDFGSGDTRMAVMDSEGNQVASVSLNTQLTADHGAGPWTLDQVATTMDNWLDANAGEVQSILLMVKCRSISRTDPITLASVMKQVLQPDLTCKMRRSTSMVMVLI